MLHGCNESVDHFNTLMGPCIMVSCHDEDVLLAGPRMLQNSNEASSRGALFLMLSSSYEMRHPKCMFVKIVSIDGAKFPEISSGTILLFIHSMRSLSPIALCLDFRSPGS